MYLIVNITFLMRGVSILLVMMARMFPFWIGEMITIKMFLYVHWDAHIVVLI